MAINNRHPINDHSTAEGSMMDVFCLTKRVRCSIRYWFCCGCYRVNLNNSGSLYRYVTFLGCWTFKSCWWNGSTCSVASKLGLCMRFAGWINSYLTCDSQSRLDAKGSLRCHWDSVQPPHPSQQRLAFWTRAVFAIHRWLLWIFFP